MDRLLFLLAVSACGLDVTVCATEFARAREAHEIVHVPMQLEVQPIVQRKPID